MKTQNVGHTPGPWAVVNTDSAEYAITGAQMLNTGSGDEPRIVAMVGQAVEMDSEDAQARADARLIAAAPELLAALDCIHNSMEGFRGVVAWAQSEAAEKAFFTARAAIRKAKGEA